MGGFLKKKSLFCINPTSTIFLRTLTLLLLMTLAQCSIHSLASTYKEKHLFKDVLHNGISKCIPCSCGVLEERFKWSFPTGCILTKVMKIKPLFAELLMVGSSPYPCTQQLRLPSVDRVNLGGDLLMKTFHSCSRKAVLNRLDNLLSFLLIGIHLGLAAGRKKAIEPHAVLCTSHTDMK